MDRNFRKNLIVDYIKKDNVDISKDLFEMGICLPSGSSLTEFDQDRIIDIVCSLF